MLEAALGWGDSHLQQFKKDGKVWSDPDLYEDGDIEGYAEFLEAIFDPKHEEFKHYRPWAGESFQPETFDLQKVSETLERMRRRKVQLYQKPDRTDMSRPGKPDIDCNDSSAAYR